MGSKTVADRQKSSMSVQTAVRNHMHIIARGLGEIYGEETGPAIAVLLDRAVEKLAQDTVSMLKADDGYTNGNDSTGVNNSKAYNGQGLVTREDRRDAIDRYDRTFSVTANLVSTLLAIAGEEDLACRVRPSAARRGRTAAMDRDSAEMQVLSLGT